MGRERSSCQWDDLRSPTAVERVGACEAVWRILVLVWMVLGLGACEVVRGGGGSLVMEGPVLCGGWRSGQVTSGLALAGLRGGS